MKTVILAGGFGTRISEESHLIPKPMVEIGGMPILWHIMKIYSSYGYNDFVICCGYKQHVIKEYFADYFLYRSDITFDFTDNGKMIVHSNENEPWKVTLVDTGLNTMTGGRVKRVQKYIGDEPFMLTYGDGVADINIDDLVKFHKDNGHIATLTAVNNDGGRINAGFMVLEPKIFDFIDGDETVFEKKPLETCASLGQLDAYMHDGFWKPMDTLREKQQLEKMWADSTAPWKIW